MLLDIEPTVFTEGDQACVVRLLEMVAIEKHDWRPSTEVALKAHGFVHEHHLSVRGLNELVVKTIEASVYPARQTRVPTRVTLDRFEDIVNDLHLPAVIVVEDEINDGAFLLGVARAFNKDRIVTAITRSPCWLSICHTGGKSRAHRFVERRRGDFTVIIRVAALLDGDRKVPRQRTDSDDMADSIRAIDGVTLVHVLAGKEMENYLPMAVWEHHFGNRQAALETVRKMLPEQRAHAALKSVIGEPRPVIPDGLELTEDDFVELGPDAVAEIKRLLAMIEEIL